MERFLTGRRDSVALPIDKGYDFVGIACPLHAGGVANLQPCEICGTLRSHGLLEGLDFIPHLGCGGHNSNSLISALACYEAIGCKNVLVVTGDKPKRSKAIFQMDSLCLLRTIRQINNKAYLKAKIDQLARVHQISPGAVVSPFKYTQASLMQQYFKMEKKIASGAKFLITQVGWDWRKSAELLQYMKERNLDTPVLGNVYMLSTTTRAAKLMHDRKLPGCFVSDELLAKLGTESFDDQIERAAQQVAMYKSMGTAGVDIGGVHDWQIFSRILARANEIGDDWVKFKDNLYWPEPGGFYLYDSQGNSTPLTKPRKKLSSRMFHLAHNHLLGRDCRFAKMLKPTLKFLGADKETTIAHKFVNGFEKAVKYWLFDCQACGDCYLPEDFGYCTIGKCEKSMVNVPCGDATSDGRCGNNLDRLCVGEYIYNAAAAQAGGVDKLRKTINRPRMHELASTSSTLNYLFGKDHTMSTGIIAIAESIHASIPKTRIMMDKLLGEDAFSLQSEALNYIKALVESQADEGASYIAVNVDAFGESNPTLAAKLMTEYVKLVRKYSNGVPVCIDSSDDNVLIAGLKEWHNTEEKVSQPLVNSIKANTMNNMMPLKADYDYAFVGMLVSEDLKGDSGSSDPVGDLYSLAQTIFNAAVDKYGFKPTEIFFDTTVFPLAIDMPMQPGASGFTYRTFETIKKIKSDPKMKDVHFSLGVTNSVRDLPGRKVGVARAYVEVAMRYGLDAGIVNTSHHFGEKPADGELVKLVEAFAALDGSAEALNNAMMLMGDFCAKSRK